MEHKMMTCEEVREEIDRLSVGRRSVPSEERMFHIHTPFWIVGFPTGIKPFYHLPNPERSDVTMSADLIAPEGYGEIIGGGQRVHDYEQLLSRINDDGLDPGDYSWYIDLRRWGTVPHSGFGLGVERVIMWMCKLDHIRDAVPFPRDMRRVFP